MPNGDDKNWIQLCATIDGFRVRYDRWPTRVRLFPGALNKIRNQLFTPEDYAKITAKLMLIADDAPMVAEDDLGGRYSYGQEGFSSERQPPRASKWLGVKPSALH
ncbi:MAG: hypothetical protein AB4040_00010 [Synechococcus sp.]